MPEVKKTFNKSKNNKKRKKQNKPPVAKTTTAQTKPFEAKQPDDKWGNPFDYKMGVVHANELLKECPSTIKPQQYLVDIVNKEFGIMGWCRRVIIEG